MIIQGPWGNKSMQPDISYPQQVLHHFYHPFRWVTFTLHASATPGRGVGTQAGIRLPCRHHSWSPSFSVYVILGDGFTIRRYKQLAMASPHAPPKSGPVWPAFLLTHCPPATAKYRTLFVGLMDQPTDISMKLSTFVPLVPGYKGMPQNFLCLPRDLVIVFQTQNTG